MKIKSFDLPETYFDSMEFTLKAGCSVGCTFCPQSIFIKNYKSDVKELSLENFSKALGNLQNSSVKTIKFSGFSEPLEGKNIYDMVFLAYNEGFKVELITTLYNFNKQNFLKIKDLPIRCHISLQPPNANNRRGYSDKLAFQNISDFLETKPACNVVFGCLNDNLSQKPKKDLEDFAKSKNISITYERKTARAGYLKNMSKPNFKNRKLICKHNLGQVALPNGDLAVCCMDFGLRHIMGNIFYQKYEDILKNKKFEDFLSIMLNEKEGDILCHTCEYAKPIASILSPKIYMSTQYMFRNLRDLLIPKNSCLRHKLNKLFR